MTRLLVLAGGAGILLSFLAFLAGRRLPATTSAILLALLVSPALALNGAGLSPTATLRDLQETFAWVALCILWPVGLAIAWYVGVRRAGRRLPAFLPWLPLGVLTLAATAQAGLAYRQREAKRAAWAEAETARDLQLWRAAEREFRACVVWLSTADPGKDALANWKRGERRLYRIDVPADYDAYAYVPGVDLVSGRPTIYEPEVIGRIGSDPRLWRIAVMPSPRRTWSNPTIGFLHGAPPSAYACTHRVYDYVESYNPVILAAGASKTLAEAATRR